MIIIDTRSNNVYSNLSKTEAGRIIGVNRDTISRWKKKRTEDGTFKEVYNSFEVYFNTNMFKQKKGNMKKDIKDDELIGKTAKLYGRVYTLMKVDRQTKLLIVTFNKDDGTPGGDTYLNLSIIDKFHPRK